MVIVAPGRSETLEIREGVFPRSLNPGDVIRVISPAGPVDPVRLEHGIEVIRGWGYRVEVGRNALHKLDYLAGSDEERLSDLLDACLDEQVRCVICSRGGYGVMRLLPMIPWAEMAAAPLKHFVGFSDVGAFQLSRLAFTGYGSWSGPQVAMGLGGAISEASKTYLRGSLDGSLRVLNWPGDDGLYLRPLRLGSAEGILIPICLSILVAMLGTPYMPCLKGAVLCLEDTNEAPYRIDRMLWQISRSGIIEQVAGLVLGRFIYGELDIGGEVEKSVLNHFGDRPFPIWMDLPFGHIDDRPTLPFGALVSLGLDNRLQLMRIRESA